MCDLVRRLEARRCGFMSPLKFQYSVTHALSSDLFETKLVYPSYSFIEDAAINYNRLLVMNSSGDVFGYDIAPKVNYEGEVFDTNAVSHYASDRSIKRMPMSHYCVQWSKCAAFFTTTGKLNYLSIIDGTYFSEISHITIPNCAFTCMHQACPDRDNVIAVASSNTGLVLADIKTGNVSMSSVGEDTTCFTALCWSQTDPNVLLTTNREAVYLWDVRMLKPKLLKIHISSTLSPPKFIDRTTIALLNRKNRLTIYDLFKQKVIRQISRSKSEFPHRKCKFYIEDKSKPMIVYLPSESFVNVHNLETGKCINQFGPHLEDINIVIKNEWTQEIFLFDRTNGHLWKPNEYANDDEYCRENWLDSFSL